jgi:hypothetical protein
VAWQPHGLGARARAPSLRARRRRALIAFASGRACPCSQVSEEELRGAFGRFGELDSVVTYAGRNYAFVNMKARFFTVKTRCCNHTLGLRGALCRLAAH